MKKFCTVVCISILIIVIFPLFNIISDMMNAASEEQQGEKVIDFEYTLRRSSGFEFVYLITEDRHVYASKDKNLMNYQSGQIENYFKIMSDQNGNPVSDVAQVSSSALRSAVSEQDGGMILRTDGQVYFWGINTKGRFGNGTTSAQYLESPTIYETGISDIVQVLSFIDTNFIVTKNGEVYASGDNSKGQFGNGTTDSSTTWIKVPIDNVSKIARGGNLQCIYAIKNDGTLYGWGERFMDGKTAAKNTLTPTQVMNASDSANVVPFENVVDISGNMPSTNAGSTQSLAIVTQVGSVADVYTIGNAAGTNYGNLAVKQYTLNNIQQVKRISNLTVGSEIVSVFADGHLYGYDHQTNPYQLLGTDTFKDGMAIPYGFYFVISETGYPYTTDSDGNPVPIILGDVLSLDAKKADGSKYADAEKYNDDISIEVVTNNVYKEITCEIENPIGNVKNTCSDYDNYHISIQARNERIHRKYYFTKGTTQRTIAVDLFKGAPQLKNYTVLTKNKINTTDIISLDVPESQADWNSYSATITNSLGQTSEFIGGTLNEGAYTIHVTDAYGNAQDYEFEVENTPVPTAIFTPSSSNFIYNDGFTKVNGNVGTISLQYPNGKATSTIKSIQLGSDGDESHFNIDTTGILKVKGSDLNAGTYNVTVSGKDGNQMDFSKTVQIVVGKADQNNYQITNDSKYNFQASQEVAITTTGNESGENETYTITSGNSIAQISNTNKFQMLSAGTFTLEATVQGNNNYNPKTDTKEITLSELPAQTNPIKVSSGDSMMYGDTYVPTSTGGTGNGNVSWSIENDSGTGANLNNGAIKVTGIGTFTLKVTKAGDSNYQSSSDSKVITVNKRKTIVKPKDVTRKVGETFKDNGVTYNPQPISGDNLGTPLITSKYPASQQAGRYTDGIQVTGLTNPNYDFEYQEGTLIINDTTLPNNGSGYYTITGTLGKNNWYISDIQISTTNKDGYDLISSDGTNFQATPIKYHTDGEYPVTFYLKNSTTGIIAKGINYQVKIDQTPPTVPTLTMNEINTSKMARLVNFLSFGNWMNKSAEVVMSSTDGTSGIDSYTYIETDTKGAINTKTTTTGEVTYKDDVEIGITAKACDKAGNCSDLSASETLMIDRKAPDITGVKDQSVYKYYYLPRFINVKDAGSGLSYAEYLKDGTQAGTIQEDVDERIDGVGKYEVNAIDNAGNEANISFEIVPLPDIEDIDGSDESKDIIDQVKDEYEDIKDNLTDDEKKEYEDWIKDAEDKWESERKKVIETDDKTSKVEGVGDTTFDPNLELIVDDITDKPIPPLPKNANAVYDVYLQKGNTKVEPGGSIKVYLPYTDEEEPIIYQIDKNGKVTEIKAEKEGNYVTFITDELGKFAISNTAQPDNKDNMCVVGPDGKVESGDEVCGKPNDKGDQPTKKPDGSVEVPDGGKVEFPNGTEIETPDGAIINPDGSVTLPDGTEYDPNGNIKDKNVCKLDGKEINIDTNGDGKPDVNIDIDGDCKPDINIDTDGDGIPNTNIDTDLDGKPDYNIDTDNDGKPNVNIGPVNDPWNPNTCGIVNEIAFCTDSYKKPYLNIDSDGDGRPDINVDLDGDMEADINIDIDGDNIPDIDIDSDGDGKPDVNVDTDHDGKADKNIVKITEWKPDKNVDGSIPYDTMSNLSSNTDSNSNGNGSQLGANMGGPLGSANTGDESKPFLWWIIVCINICMMIYCYRKVRKEQKQ